MISRELLAVLVVSTILMGAIITIQMKWYEIPRWKCIVVAVALVCTGVLGSKVWYFVENLSWGGRSLYGAIVFSPLAFWPISKGICIDYLDALDCCAPAGCLTLALVKLQCLRDNCCQGMVLYIDENHKYVRFPSQIVEMVVFLLIAAVLFFMSSKRQFRKKIFPWFLVLYGVARFGLDFLRETIPSYLFGLSAGSFWSLCSCIVGVVILLLMRRSEKAKENP